MRRRTLDIIFSTGGLLLSGLLVLLGVVLLSNANFAKDYVGDQLSSQQLTFKSIDKITPTEKAYTGAHTNCLVTYAGKQVTTGKQAECWANEYIGGHLKDPNKIANADGKSYAALGVVLADLRTQIAAAETAKDPNLPALQQKLDDVTTARATVFQGEMLRNALLTSYGFSVLGDKAETGATLVFLAAGVLFLLACAGYVHAARTPSTVAFAPVEAPQRSRVSA